MRCGLRPLCRCCSHLCRLAELLPSVSCQLPHILFSESIIPNGQKIARGISSVGKFRDRKRIDKAGKVPYNKDGQNDASFIHNVLPNENPQKQHLLRVFYSLFCFYHSAGTRAYFAPG